MKKSALCLFLILTSFIFSPATETNSPPASLIDAVMTPARFREIVKRPADSMPLISQLVQIPYWTNAVISNVMTYASGKVFSETMSQRAWTIEGKFIVFTVSSKFYGQPMHSIVTYDHKSATLKAYGLFGDSHGVEVVTEGVMKFDSSKQTYSIRSEYGDGFKETTSGSYSEREDIAKSIILQNGKLFMTRNVVTRPAAE